MRYDYVIAMMALIGPAASVERDGRCFDNDDNDLGPAGAVRIEDGENPFEGSLLIRKTRKDRCPCSYVDLKCEIDDGSGMDCNDYIIDGIDAAENGYPDINIKHSMKICNYNNENQINLAPSNKRNHVKMQYPVGDNIVQVIALEEYSEQILKAGECYENIGTSTVSAEYAKYFMEGYVQGMQSDSEGKIIEGGHCYAFGYNKVNFKYNYGLQTCEISTELSCTPEDSSFDTCSDYINANLGQCATFKGTFRAKACNEMDRDITLFEQRSSYKVQRSNENGAYEETEEPLLPTILANTCQEFETVADINPCDKNFWKVRVRGNLHNEKAENNWMYKDLDCASVLSEELPMAREEVTEPIATIVPNATEVPSVSPTTAPVETNATSVEPSVSPSAPKNFTVAPSLPENFTVAPSHAPSTPKNFTAAPSVLPTVHSDEKGAGTSSVTSSSGYSIVKNQVLGTTGAILFGVACAIFI